MPPKKKTSGKKSHEADEDDPYIADRDMVHSSILTLGAVVLRESEPLPCQPSKHATSLLFSLDLWYVSAKKGTDDWKQLVGQGDLLAKALTMLLGIAARWSELESWIEAVRPAYAARFGSFDGASLLAQGDSELCAADAVLAALRVALLQIGPVDVRAHAPLINPRAAEVVLDILGRARSLMLGKLLQLLRELDDSWPFAAEFSSPLAERGALTLLFGRPATDRADPAELGQTQVQLLGLAAVILGRYICRTLVEKLSPAICRAMLGMAEQQLSRTKIEPNDFVGVFGAVTGLITVHRDATSEEMQEFLQQLYEEFLKPENDIRRIVGNILTAVDNYGANNKWMLREFLIELLYAVVYGYSKLDREVRDRHLAAFLTARSALSDTTGASVMLSQSFCSVHASYWLKRLALLRRYFETMAVPPAQGSEAEKAVGC